MFNIVQSTSKLIHSWGSKKKKKDSKTFIIVYEIFWFIARNAKIPKNAKNEFEWTTKHVF